MRKKRVLLLSEGFGAGHTQAAHALSVGLRQLSSFNVSTRVLELGAFLHPTIAPLIFTAYRKTVTSQPKLIGKLYRSKYHKTLNPFTQMALHRIFYAQTASIINQLRPDTIVCTHPFPNIVISRLKRLGMLIPLCTVITDYDVHGTWIDPEVNTYLVPTEEVKNKMLQKGVPPAKIVVTGIPLHPDFWEKHNREELRTQFELKMMPTVLVMGGGWGLVNNEEFMHYIAGFRDRVQLIFCLGNNDKFRLKLSEEELFQHPNIRLLGFTKEINKYMEVSDLLITKPGGMTCTEGMAKGIPMLFYEPIPGQEEENCQHFIDLGFGEQIESKETIDRWIDLLTNNYAQVSLRRDVVVKQLAEFNPKVGSETILQLLS